jgi:hypothetical protein
MYMNVSSQMVHRRKFDAVLIQPECKHQQLTQQSNTQTQAPTAPHQLVCRCPLQFVSPAGCTLTRFESSSLPASMCVSARLAWMSSDSAGSEVAFASRRSRRLLWYWLAPLVL